ncbi:MAG: GGDEF domain-containing protein [Rhodobacterales bacterium]|nr:GGDEF domain-containing protein [Rhodobacterales bacterium]
MAGFLSEEKLLAAARRATKVPLGLSVARTILLSVSGSVAFCYGIYALWVPGYFSQPVALLLPILAPLLISGPLMYVKHSLFLVMARKEADWRREVEQRRQAEAEARHLALTDHLTETANRRQLMLLGGQAEKHARRTGVDLSVAVIDLDRFKAINDTHGHAVGDEALKTVARRIKDSLREADVLARYGGEEFVVLFDGADHTYAAAVAERLRAAVAAAPVVVGDTLIPVTASIGVASQAGPDVSLSSVLLRADAAMYRAKDQGRNRVVIDQPDVQGSGFGQGDKAAEPLRGQAF